MHISSQLAKHQADLRGFYDRISQQTEGLKNMLDSLDVSVLAAATERAAAMNSEERERDSIKTERKILVFIKFDIEESQVPMEVLILHFNKLLGGLLYLLKM